MSDDPNGPVTDDPASGPPREIGSARSGAAYRDRVISGTVPLGGIDDPETLAVG